MKRYTVEEINAKIKRRNRIKKIASAIIYPIIIAVLLCNIYLLIQKITLPERIPNLFGYKAFTIMSGSMEPTLEVGDIIIIKETNQENIKENDIITFKEADYVITHRLINIIEENGEVYYETKGDNNDTADKKFVQYSEIEGVYAFRIKKLGNVVIYAQNTILVVIVIIYLIYTLVSRSDDRKTYRREKRKEFEKEQDDNE